MQGEGNKQTYTTDANSNAYNVKVSGDGLVVSVWEMVLGLVSLLSGGRVTGVLGRGVLGRGRVFLRVKADGRPHVRFERCRGRLLVEPSCVYTDPRLGPKWFSNCAQMCFQNLMLNMRG